MDDALYHHRALTGFLGIGCATFFIFLVDKEDLRSYISFINTADGAKQMAYEFGGMLYACERDLVAAKVDFWLGGYVSEGTVRETLASGSDEDLADRYMADDERHDGKPCADDRRFVIAGIELAREDYK